MTASGRPQKTSATISVRTSRSDRVDDRARIAPSSPPSPSAALSSPSPDWPMPRSSIAATTTRALSRPRVTTWPYVPSIDQRRTGGLRTARRPSRSPAPGAAACPPPPAASPACSNRSPAATSAVTRKATAATSGDDGVEPDRHQGAGDERPDERAEPSPVLHAVLAATSSPGLRASAGIRVTWVGRTGAPAAAATAAKHEEQDQRRSGGRPSSGRRSRSSARSRARRQRGASRARRGSGRRGSARQGAREHADDDGGDQPDAPSRPAARTPPRLKTVTRVTTTSAASAAIPSVHEIPSRRIPSLARASRTAETANVRPPRNRWASEGGAEGAASSGTGPPEQHLPGQTGRRRRLERYAAPTSTASREATAADELFEATRSEWATPPPPAGDPSEEQDRGHRPADQRDRGRRPLRRRERDQPLLRDPRQRDAH